MDESWRMSIGGGFAHNSSSRRRSVVNRPDVPSDDEDDDDDDFHDVFGGPPRILRHRRSAAAGFYKEVFSPPLAAAAEAAVGITGRRNLPGFRIPPAPNNRRPSLGVATEDDFYDDIFTAAADAAAAVPARDRRSRSRSTTKSSSGNNRKSRSNSSSSDHDSSTTSYLINSRPCANPCSSSTIVHHDAALSSFASKLRPITIPTRQHDSSQPSTLSGGGGGGGGGGGSSNRTVPISNIQFSSFAETRSSYYCPNCCGKQMTTNDGMYHFSGAGSPSSVTSSAGLEPILSTAAPVELRELEKKVVLEVKQERERSFVNRHFVRETEGAAAVDEAIAWASGKFWNQQAASEITSDEILEYSEEQPKGGKEKPPLN